MQRIKSYSIFTARQMHILHPYMYRWDFFLHGNLYLSLHYVPLFTFLTHSLCLWRIMPKLVRNFAKCTINPQKLAKTSKIWAKVTKSFAKSGHTALILNMSKHSLCCNSSRTSSFSWLPSTTTTPLLHHAIIKLLHLNSTSTGMAHPLLPHRRKRLPKLTQLNGKYVD